MKTIKKYQKAYIKAKDNLDRAVQAINLATEQLVPDYTDKNVDWLEIERKIVEAEKKVGYQEKWDIATLAENELMYEAKKVALTKANPKQKKDIELVFGTTDRQIKEKAIALALSL